MDCFLCSAVFADDFEGVSQALLQEAVENCHCEECNPAFRGKAISFSVGPASCRSFELTGKMRLSQNPKMAGFPGSGASRSALISGGSRTAPTGEVAKSRVLRQPQMPVPLNPCPTTGDCFGLRPRNGKFMVFRISKRS
jgi:hypothetical protein